MGVYGVRVNCGDGYGSRYGNVGLGTWYAVGISAEIEVGFGEARLY